MTKINLSSAKKYKKYKIKALDIDNNQVSKFLDSLGFRINEEIELRGTNYKKSSYLIKVMGISYMIDKDVCDRIYIDE